jgi:hypothetical protein
MAYPKLLMTETRRDGTLVRLGPGLLPVVIKQRYRGRLPAATAADQTGSGYVHPFRNRRGGGSSGTVLKAAPCVMSP